MELEKTRMEKIMEKNHLKTFPFSLLVYIRGRKLGKIFFHVGKRENKFSHVGKTRKTRKNENLPYGLEETLKTLIIRF